VSFLNPSASLPFDDEAAISLTYNTAEFNRMDGLPLEDWEVEQ
jgi:hypothetical protein